MKKHLATLGLPSDAGPVQIRKAYLRLSKMYHPDLNGGGAFYEEKFKAINEAYQNLKKEKQAVPVSFFNRGKRAYDRWSTPDYSRQEDQSTTTYETSRENIGRSAFGPAGIFSVILFGLIIIMPIWLASPEKANLSGTTRDPDAASSFVVTTGSAADKPEDFRFRRDLEIYQSLREDDPQLTGLDLETGYYDGHGRSVKFSWQFIRYLKKNRPR